ncbi:hypothetical protein FKR81_40960 [Lentzea tibetensis]|uniref:DUF6875 domain-containing protein n=1 Tax=Lentzea tibetensis TaxID=2591470 RepID=A0A563EFQ6_9PSEU|nr:hypothetical protein [Lentzea tibetensis]TWP44750.1 hypothetical protein FKR81_40960 [Lentzea tibetensis]
MEGGVNVHDVDALTEVVRWAREFLVPGHADLGRTGPVCPYTQASMRRDLFHLDVRHGTPDLDALRVRYAEWADQLDVTERELLTYLLVLPDADPFELDALQRKAKDEFVASGLMIGQFHPSCDEPGLWNRNFRPLRSPVPLLAIRQLLPADLPFMFGTKGHLDSYFTRFAPALPARVRGQLVTRLATSPDRVESVRDAAH